MKRAFYEHIKTIVFVILLCGVTMLASAKNNRQGFSKKLYPLYTKAYNLRHTSKGPLLADSLRKSAIAIGDKFGEIASLQVKIQHEFYKKDNLQNVEKLTTQITDIARQYGMWNYYYYAISLNIAYLLKVHKYLEAFLLQNSQIDYAKKNGHNEWVWTLYRMNGVNLHFRHELSQAINSYQKTIDCYLENNFKKYVSREYRSICDCYRMMGDFENMAKTADKSLKYALDKNDSNKVYIYKCYSSFMLRNDKEFIDCYNYLQKNKPTIDKSYETMNNAIKACKAIYDNKIDDAKAIIDNIKKKNEEESCRLFSALFERNNDFAKSLEYTERLMFKHFESSKYVFDCDKKSMENIFIDQHLKAEQQEIKNRSIRLELSNAQMLLRNSSLELEHSQYATQLAQAASNKQQLSNQNQKLLARQLNDSIARQTLKEQQHNRKLKMEDFATKAITISALLIMAMTFLFIFRKRNIAKKIREGNEQLNDNIKKLFIAKDKAMQSERMKTMFIQNMSHEIRTPLNAIVGFSQLLTDTNYELDKEEKTKMTTYIADNSDMLITIVNDILDITDLENNSYVMNDDKVNVNGMCRHTIETVRHRLADGVELKFDTDIDEGCIMITDHNRVAQVIINMLTNAEKNTTKGSITLSCSNAENPEMITFSVTDTGIGVPKDKQKEIFERFRKLDNFKQGTGLGLDICRNIASKLGGSINIDPGYTGGARFCFTIPFKKLK